MLGLTYCNYTIDIIDNKIVSKCNNFLNESEEIITANDIFFSEKKGNDVSDIEHYCNILAKNGIENAREKVENMFLVDFIVLNYDRHLKNFGIIRNVETLKWENTTPIFDSGESMECDYLINEINFADRKGKFFTSTEESFSSIVRYIDLKRYDFSSLYGLEDEYRNKLIEYKPFTEISDERINALVEGLNYRICIVNSLKNDKLIIKRK